MLTVERATSPTEEVAALVAALEAELAQHYPPENRHGLALAALFEPHLRFFVARLDGVAAGCGGIALFDGFAELKRMFVRPEARCRGVAQAILARLESEARTAGSARLMLETGDRQIAAIRFYEAAGFTPCGAFGGYLAMAPQAIASSRFYAKPSEPGPLI